MPLTLRLLGAPEILLDGQEIGVSRRKSRALIYYLGAQAGAVLRESLLSIFWADLPRLTAQQTLRTTLHGLRRALGEGIVVQGDRVTLAPSVVVDAREFERRLTVPPINPLELSEALDLYRGEFLEGFILAGVQPFEDWLTVSREHYRRLALRGWAALAAHYESEGNFQSALDCLERALAVDRLQEDLQRDAMRLLYLAGDRPAAIRRYDDLRRLLDEEMGVPPMAETRRLYDDMINDRLESPAAAPVAPAPVRPRQESRLTAGMRAALLPLRSVTPSSVDRLPFTGRQSELQALHDITASPRLALIEGEAGVGKTRLAEQFLEQLALATGALPLVGRGRELEGAFPYLPLVEALRGLLALPDWETLRPQVQAALPPVWLAEVGRLLPELGAGPSGAAPRAAEEARLWEGVRYFLTAVARQRPLALLIDDLHWVDASTYGLLAYLLRHCGEGGVRFVATLRTGVSRAALATFLQTLVREDRLRRVPLQRLSSAEVQAVAERLSAREPERLAGWLYATSEGNPYILSELVRFARQSGVMDRDGRLDPQALPSGPVVPQTIFSLIQARLAALSEEARRVLDAAVAQGRDFEFPIVARAAGLSEAAALDALDELQSAGVVIPKEGNWFRFDHPLTMEVAYQEVGELRHRRMHRRVAEALEQLYLDRLDEVAGQLAWHFFEGDAPTRGARYALQAAEQAGRLAAWSETISFYEIALKGLSGSARLPVLIQLGQTHALAGSFARASEILSAALHQAESSGTSQALLDQIRLALARTLITQARFPEVIQLANELRHTGSPETAIVAETLRGTALSLQGVDLESAASQLKAAQELWLSHRGADPLLLAHAQFELGNVAAQEGDLEAAVESYRQALATASQVDNYQADEWRVLAYNNLAYHLHLLGDPSAASQYARLGLELANEKGLVGILTYLHSTLGEIALAADELDEAEQHFSTGLDLAERFSAQERVAGLTANLGRLAARRGQAALALHNLSQALGQADALGARHLAAHIRLWLAPLLPPDQARRRLSEARAFAESSGRQRLMTEVELLEREIG